ncbi:MAG: phosphorylase family protein, partial [Planctomycetota bacterium]
MAEERIPVAVTAATRFELGAVVPLLSGRAVRRSGPFDYETGFLEGVRTAAARTGIGLEHAAARIEELFRAVRPRVLIATGFAGGLDPESATGDLVLAEEVWD